MRLRLLLASICALSLATEASSEVSQNGSLSQNNDSTSAIAESSIDTPVTANSDPLAGLKLIEKHQGVEPVVIEDGVFFQDIVEGAGNSPEYADAIFFLVKSYDANGGELNIGESNHTHPEGTPDEHEHARNFSARWIFYAAGGGTFSMGDGRLDQLFSAALSGMKEMGTRLIYVSSDQAYGETGYEGHEFTVPPNTDILLRVTMLRVREVKRPEDLGFQ